MVSSSHPIATSLYPFVPSAPDFQQSIAFFNAIGFKTVWTAKVLSPTVRETRRGNSHLK